MKHSTQELLKQLQRPWKLPRPAQKRKLAMTQDIQAVVAWLRSTFYVGDTGSIAKRVVYVEYCSWCERTKRKKEQASFFGKVVRQAFPGIESERRGPRGSAKQHYRHLNYIHNRNNNNLPAVASPAPVTAVPIKSEGESVVKVEPLAFRLPFEDIDQPLNHCQQEPISPGRYGVYQLHQAQFDDNQLSPDYQQSPLAYSPREESPVCSPPFISDRSLDAPEPTYPTTTPAPESLPLEKALDLAFQHYYENLLMAMLYGVDLDIKRVIATFWAQTLPGLCNGRARDEVEIAILTNEKKGSALIQAELLRNPCALPPSEHTELLTNLACYLPLWIKLLTVELLPSNMSLALMDIWNEFGQLLWHAARSHCIPSTFTEDSCSPVLDEDMISFTDSLLASDSSYMEDNHSCGNASCV